MTRQPEIKISTVTVTIPVNLQPGRRSKHDPDNPTVSLELWSDGLRFWDGATYTQCGEHYSFADETQRVIGRSYNQLPDLPYFDQVYRYLVDQQAANRGNPLGHHIATAVDAMDRAICERTGSRVYFAQAGNRIKIGWSRNVGARIAKLQTANPEPIRLLATVSGGRALERQLHDRFAAARVTGEWFDAHPDLLAYIGALS